MNRKYNHLLAFAASALLLFGCADNDNITDEKNDGQAKNISFSVDVSQDWKAEQPATRAILEQHQIRTFEIQGTDGTTAWLTEKTRTGIDEKLDGVQGSPLLEELEGFALDTRGTQITSSAGMSDFASFSYKDDGSLYYANVRCNKDGDLSTSKIWDGENPMRFYAIHPYNANATYGGTVQAMTYDFTVNSANASETDFMYASTGMVNPPATGAKRAVVNLHFKHALAAVKFAFGDNPDFGKTLTSIKLGNVKTHGRLTLPATDVTYATNDSWSNLDTPGTLELTGLEVAATTASANTSITNDSQYFLVIPQDLNGVQIELGFSDGTKLRKTLNSGSWAIGTTTTYELNMSTTPGEDWTYTLEATSPTSAAEYTSTNGGNYGVVSYRQSGVTQQAVSWTVTKYEYSDDGGTTWVDNGTTKPSWLTSLSKTSGNGGVEREDGSSEITTSITDEKALRDQALQNATAKSNYDLSQGGETANSYVISAPGTYKIPLIYGNMRMSDGNINTECLGSTSELQATFVNAAGTKLSTLNDMYIQGVDASTTAAVVWKDVTTNIVSNLAVDVTNKFLTFTVNKNDLVQGNAVVGIKGTDGKYLWSWHLWFAPESVLTTIPCTNHQNVTYDFTSEPLGMTYDAWNYSTYNVARKIRVTVTQTGSNKTGSFIITQDPGKTFDFHTALFQFGRKDALPSIVSYPELTLDDITDNQMNYATSIQNPLYICYSNLDDGSWCTHNYPNCWSAENTLYTGNDNPVIKTVYDPSPAGYHVPASNAFTGFTTSGDDTQDAACINADGAFDKGYHFYTSSDQTTTIFFPAGGFRHGLNVETSLNYSYAQYWTAIPALHFTHEDGGRMFFYANRVNPFFYAVTHAGSTVFPVAYKDSEIPGSSSNNNETTTPGFGASLSEMGTGTLQ
jgi:hypothetical protein